MQVLLRNLLETVVLLRSQADGARWFTRGVHVTFIWHGNRWYIYKAETFAIS